MRRATRAISRPGERGSTSIEFAILGSSFLLLILGVFELGYMVFVQSVLDNASRDAARLIRTGQVQASSNAQQAFQTQLCNEVSSIIGCAKIIYQAQTFGSWSAAQTTLNQPPKRDKNGNLVSVGFTPGTADAIVAVQVTYNYPFFTLWVGGLLGGSLHSAFLSATVVFQNEPFS